MAKSNRIKSAVAKTKQAVQSAQSQIAAAKASAYASRKEFVGWPLIWMIITSLFAGLVVLAIYLISTSGQQEQSSSVSWSTYVAIILVISGVIWLASQAGDKKHLAPSSKKEEKSKAQEWWDKNKWVLGLLALAIGFAITVLFFPISEFWFAKALWRAQGVFWTSLAGIFFGLCLLTVGEKTVVKTNVALSILAITLIADFLYCRHRQPAEGASLASRSDSITRLLEEPTVSIPVPKGKVYKVRRENIRRLDNMAILVRYDGQGPFILQTPEDFNKPGGLNKLPRHVRTIELLSEGRDFTVVVVPET